MCSSGFVSGSTVSDIEIKIVAERSSRILRPGSAVSNITGEQIEFRNKVSGRKLDDSLHAEFCLRNCNRNLMRLLNAILNRNWSTIRRTI
jgi:hypothetical protein